MAQIDPYRVLFPIGMLAAVMGAGVWLVYAALVSEPYPVELHRRLMVGGFLHVFAAGFLMTAIPRFTGSFLATLPEIVLQSLADSLWLVSAFDVTGSLFWWLGTAHFFCLALFFVRRLLRRTHTVYFLFLYIALGLASGFFSALAVSLGPWIAAFESFGAVARIYFFHGAIWALVVGVGGRIVTGFLGWPITWGRSPETATRTVAYLNNNPMQTAVAMVLLGSFFVEGWVSVAWGRTLRALAVTATLGIGWRLYRPPHLRTPVTLGLWLSGWGIHAGLWLYALFPAYGVHLLHVALVAGLALTTVMMATRVSLAHGKHTTHGEQSRFFAVITVAMIAAAVIRLVAPMSGIWYAPLVGVSSALWLASFFSWASFILPKIVFVK